MIDRLKRKTLKLTVAGAAVIHTPLLWARTNSWTQQITADDSSVSDRPLDVFDVSIRHNPVDNDIEIAITNVGNESATITTLTPAQLNTARGHFSVDQLTKEGPLKIARGETVCVPLTHWQNEELLESRALPRDNVVKSLQEQMSVITDGDAFAELRFHTNSSIG